MSQINSNKACTESKLNMITDRASGEINKRTPLTLPFSEAGNQPDADIGRTHFRLAVNPAK